MTKAQGGKRISTRINTKFLFKLRETLQELDWSESEYVRRAVEEYYPRAKKLAEAISEKKNAGS